MIYRKHLLTLSVVLAASSMPLTAIAQPQVLQAQASKNVAVSLDQVLSLALERSPALSSARSNAEAYSSAVGAAGALPNPEISFEVENIYGSGPYDGTRSAEMTYGISQLIEIPGKRSNRVAMAETDQAKAGQNERVTKLNLIRDVKLVYAEAVTLRQKIKILEDEAQLVGEVYESVAAKVEAGKEPLVQKKKAQVELDLSHTNLEEARRQYQAQLQSLQILTGNQSIEDVVVESLPKIEAPEAISVYQGLLMQAPELQQVDMDINRAESALSFEKVSFLPDPTINFGVRNYREDGEKAFVAGISFPLPVFNMNRSNIERAGHELNVAKFERQGMRQTADSALARAYADFVNAFNKTTSIQEKILPTSQDAFDFARSGYDAGKFDYLEVLDAQRTMFDARQQLNEAALNYYQQKAVLERIVALDTSKPINEKKDK